MSVEAEGPARVEVQVRSALCVTIPPDVVGLGDDQREFYVRTARGSAGRRRVARGDHLDPAHELVALFPSHFSWSAELPDVVVLSRPSEETLARQLAERQRRLPRLAQEITWVCLNCKERWSAVAAIPTLPTRPEIGGRLAGVEGDPAAEARVKFLADFLEREYREAVAAEQAAAVAFKQAHTLCDPAKAKGLPEPPEWDGRQTKWWPWPFERSGR